jgi:hypothetical protein
MPMARNRVFMGAARPKGGAPRVERNLFAEPPAWAVIPFRGRRRSVHGGCERNFLVSHAPEKK